MPAGDERRFPRFLRGWAIACGLSRSAGKRCRHARSVGRTAGGCGNAETLSRRITSAGSPAPGASTAGAHAPIRGGTPWSAAKGVAGSCSTLHALHFVQGVPPPKASVIVVRTFHVRTELREDFDVAKKLFRWTEVAWLRPLAVLRRLLTSGCRQALLEKPAVAPQSAMPLPGWVTPRLREEDANHSTNSSQKTSPSLHP